MAARKRRHSSTTKRRRRAANPKRRRSTAIVRARRSNALFTRRRRRANPLRRRGRRIGARRRRNPVSSGVIAEGLVLGASGIVIGLTQPFVRGLVDKFVGASPLASAGVTLGTAYGLSWLAGMIKAASSYKKPLELAGWTLAFTQLATSYVLPMLRPGSGAPAGMSGPYRRRGMSGIAAVHGIPPIITPPPLPPAPATAQNGNSSSGMSGMAAIPGRFAR